MSEEFSAHAFDMFTQEKVTSRSTYQGTGLGLAIVKQLVDRMGGSITLQSRPGAGTTVTVKLPFKIGKQDDLKPAAQVKGDISFKGLRALVVEDNELNMEIACCMLENSGMEVTRAADGQEAVELFGKSVPGCFGVIYMDIMMPRMDGIELIRHIKENVNTCDIPIIILSAKSSVEDRIQGLQLGIDDYIPKPFSSDYLKSRIENLIRQRKVLQSAFLSKYGAQPKKEPLEAIAYPVSQIVPLDELFMQKLVGFMEENYSNPGLRVNDLAEFMNMSRSVFNRKVNGIMGISPIEYIKNYRLNKAKSFIQSGMSFSEVAFAVGFSDPGYFGKAFKKAFNQTLTEYKNNN